MRCGKKHRFILAAAIVGTHCMFIHRAPAEEAGTGPGAPPDPFPSVYADPAVPLLQLPTNFRARRTSTGISVDKDRSVDILNVEGAGCVRHVWFVFSQYNLSDLEIEIAVDGASKPQVRMPLRSFFGVLLGFEDYHIDSAALAIFPNFTVTNDPHIPPKASPGWNFYLPIPFSMGCRITLHSQTAKGGSAMIDWQQYKGHVDLTSLRFHAQRNIALPASPSEPFPIAETEGAGFLAGYIMGWRQKERSDMVFHNSGTRLLIDGQTDPHVIVGHNVEDDFGFSWGFNRYQTRWAGCPFRDNRGRNDQDGVFYRFFGPDPILFRSSLIFTSNARADDYEAVSYFYRVADSQAPRVVTPEKWQAVGAFPDGHDLGVFQRPAEAMIEQLSRAEWPERLTFGTTEYFVRNLTSKYGWLRLGNAYQLRSAYPMTDHSVYVRTTLKSDADRQTTLRLGFDNWAIVYLNGKQVVMLDHAAEFETARIPITLKRGDNQLLIKTNNRVNRDALVWAINCVIE